LYIISSEEDGNKSSDLEIQRFWIFWKITINYILKLSVSNDINIIIFFFEINVILTKLT